EFSAKARRSLQEPRQTAVNPVQNCGKYNRGERKHIAAFEGHPDRSQSGAHRKQRDHIRRERAHRNAAEPPAPRVTRTWRCNCHDSNIAARAGACHWVAAAIPSGGRPYCPTALLPPESVSPPVPPDPSPPPSRLPPPCPP